MVENLKLPLCKEKRSCYLNAQSASAAVKKKNMVYVPFDNKPMYYRYSKREGVNDEIAFVSEVVYAFITTNHSVLLTDNNLICAFHHLWLIWKLLRLFYADHGYLLVWRNEET